MSEIWLFYAEMDPVLKFNPSLDEKKTMNTIKLLQKGVEGVTMRTPDPEFGFGDEDGDDEEGTVFEIQSNIF